MLSCLPLTRLIKSTAETDSRLRQQLLITGSTISNNRTHVHISLQTAGDPSDNLWPLTLTTTLTLIMGIWLLYQTQCPVVMQHNGSIGAVHAAAYGQTCPTGAFITHSSGFNKAAANYFLRSWHLCCNYCHLYWNKSWRGLWRLLY